MLIVLESGGFKGGGVNFDAKIRRNFTNPEDLFYAHSGSMDVFARGEPKLTIGRQEYLENIINRFI